MDNLRIFFVFVCVLPVLGGCFPKVRPYTGADAFSSIGGNPDYEKLEYWAAHPGKWDPSDSLRRREKKFYNDQKVDVFYLHPTTFTEDNMKYGDNAHIDDPYINKKTDYTAVLYQASVFKKNCRIYAPRYRQAHISMYYTKDSLAKKKAFELAYNDVVQSFNTFLAFRGKNRPFILASHSQGTTHAYQLLKEVILSSSEKSQLVAAYLIGMPVPRMDDKIAVCKDTNMVGCMISWRTYAMNYGHTNLNPTDESKVVVNPILWTIDTTLSKRQDHKGMVLYNYQKTYRNALVAKVKGDALYISKPKFIGSLFMNMKNYHAGDYNLFYKNLEEDVERRIREYFLSR
ncbi:MAG: DUF3089 domain-containing protein [Bacteroidetes bacterium]|nr:DUF3089 domain-containing protein [Bacteroidota bacterium]